MKYVVVANARPVTGSAIENEEAVPRILELLTKWLDGAGGYVVAETDNPSDLVEAASSFSPYYDFQVHPVIDFAEAVPAVQKGIEYRKSIG
jgi:hypothetical protein